MTTISTLTKVTDTDGATGAGGSSGQPPSAGTAAMQTSAIANRRLFTLGLSPFSEANEPDSITEPEPLFAQFWTLRCANEPGRALAVCDRLLEVIDPQDFTSHLRQSSARAIALRDLHRFREAKAVHLAARPFLPSAQPVPVADHFRGLGVTLAELGEHVRAFKAFEDARKLYVLAGESGRASRVSVAVARLYVYSGHPASAHALLNGCEGADVEVVRAMAYEAEGNKPAARKAIATALYLLSDSENQATRTEALCAMGRIEGATAYRELVGEGRG